MCKAKFIASSGYTVSSVLSFWLDLKFFRVRFPTFSRSLVRVTQLESFKYLFSSRHFQFSSFLKVQVSTLPSQVFNFFKVLGPSDPT